MKLGLRASLVLTSGMLVLALSASVASADVYRYVDDDGVPHFSDSVGSIPERYRDQVREISEELKARPGVKVIPGMNGPAGAGGAGAEAQAHAGSDAGSEATTSFDMAAGEGELGAAKQLWHRFGVLVIVGFLLAIPIALMVGALILTLSCKLAAPDTPGFGRAVAIVFVQGLVGTAINGATLGVKLSLGISDDGSASSVVVDLISALTAWTAYAGVLSAMSEIGFARALWVMVVYVILAVVLIAVPVVIIVVLTAL